MNHNNQNKIALINDYTGFGRCSVAVQLPVISQMKIQCCPLPTSIFSNHTGYKEFRYIDYTPYMRDYISMWKKLDLQFKGICTGFLGSSEQIQIVSEFIHDFKRDDTLVIVDPVMGDYGKPYPTYTDEMCNNMFHLVQLADIVTPNLTEACILTKTTYKEKWKTKELIGLAQKVSELGPSKVVITGIPQKSFLCNLYFEENGASGFIKTHKVGTSRNGTGDIFSAIIAADAVNHVDFKDSVKKASRFIKKCLEKAIEMDLPNTDGVPFEELIYTLKGN